MGLLVEALWLLAFVSCVAAVTVELSLDGSYTTISSPGYPYPIPPNTRYNWEIRSPPGTKASLYCYEIRLIQDNPPGCDQDLLVIDGGEKRLELCGQHHGLSVLSRENVIYVYLMTGEDESGGFTCVARSTREAGGPVTTPQPMPDPQPEPKPEVGPLEVRVDLPAGGEPYQFTSYNYPNLPPDYLKQDWHFNTASGSAVRVTCSDLRLLQKTNGECADETVTVTDGKSTQVLCGLKSGFTMLSSSNRMSVSFRTGKYARGAFSCEAEGKLMDWYGEVTTTTTTVAPPPPYLGIPSEEVDSTEHGVLPGPKSTNCRCGWANKHPEARIVNGVETRPNEFPFMVAVIDTFRGFQFCGGSLITAYHVLTAAHCTYKHLLAGRSISVVIGDHNLYTDDETNATRTIEVVRIVQHLEYNAWSLKNDISLLVLGERVEFNRLVGPVCLSKVQLEIPMQYVSIIGWGNLRWQGSSPDVLQKVHVRVVHRSSCSEVFFLVDDINATQICTYASAKASCQGDSGGPVIWLDPETNRYVQVGLVSFGTVCADTNPTVHTDVTAYYDWIQDNIKDSTSDSDSAVRMPEKHPIRY